MTHEVSHVLLHHTPGPTSAAPELPNAALIDASEVAELAADVLAFHIVTEDLRRAGPAATFSEILFRVVGARLVFECIEMIENHTYVVAARTHPPARRRWDAIRAYAVEAFGKTTTQRIDTMWTPFTTIAHQLDHDHPAVEVIVENYQQLLDQHTLLDAPLPPSALTSLLTRADYGNLDQDELRDRLASPPRIQTGDGWEAETLVSDVVARLTTQPTPRGLTWLHLHREIGHTLHRDNPHKQLPEEDHWALTAMAAQRLRACDGW